MLDEMTDSRCAECVIIDQLRAHFEAEYERKAAEMRRMRNQAHEQLEVATREIRQLQKAVLQSYIAARRVLDGYEGEVSMPICGTISIVEQQLSRAIPSVRGAWVAWTERHPLEGE